MSLKLKLGLLILTGVLISCGGGGGTPSTTGGLAPNSVNGKTYNLSITSGSGNFASTGTAQIIFASTTYSIIGDGVNVSNSQGTYSASKTDNNTVKLTISDPVIGDVVYTLNFSTNISGTFSVSAGGSGQSGTFTE